MQILSSSSLLSLPHSFPLSYGVFYVLIMCPTWFQMLRNHFSFDISFGRNNKYLRACLKSALKKLLPTYENIALELGGKEGAQVKPGAYSPSKAISNLSLHVGTPAHLPTQPPTGFSALPNPERAPSFLLPKYGLDMSHPSRQMPLEGFPCQVLHARQQQNLKVITAIACTSQGQLVCIPAASW